MIPMKLALWLFPGACWICFLTTQAREAPHRSQKSHVHSTALQRFRRCLIFISLLSIPPRIPSTDLNLLFRESTRIELSCSLLV
ncbi:hypothetical protein CC78DRAFT_102571 [Lojkania enalia]|uniref:Secreted protein n=1 Tax=Lojkania enalia TaxID=147567 RepID=A0A9P4N7P9_9PLEO|nr:hypothetical protein CC78DRAFT_102571 [Didymosphaeria enalia]